MNAITSPVREYRGYRDEEGACMLFRVHEDETAVLIGSSWDSPLGWGDVGVGSQATAETLLADAIGPAVARRAVGRFKWSVVAGLTTDEWTMSADDVRRRYALIRSNAL